MIVHQFTTFPYGGAGGAAVRHHLALRDRSIDSRLFVRTPDNRENTGPAQAIPELHECQFATDVPAAGFLKTIQDKRRRRKICLEYERHLKHRPADWETFADPQQLTPTHLTSSTVDADIIHLHWISFLADYPSFFRSFHRGQPLVWTLHDMNPFTGGCHYASGCERFREHCGNCPQLIDPRPRDLSWRGFKSKRSALAAHRIHVVSPSRWLDRLTQTSPVWPPGTTFSVIPYGLDTAVFRPIDQPAARHQLGLPADRILLGFGADDLSNPRKGWRWLIAALDCLPKSLPLQLVTFGRSPPPVDALSLPVHHLGFVADAETMAQVYSACDLYALPSVEDNLPQTGLEAIACGRPVVGFDAGGVPDIVRDNQSGLLSPVGDYRRMSSQIAQLVGNPAMRRQLSTSARQLALREFDRHRQTQRYIELYGNLLCAASRSGSAAA